jgi:hypothetical protein
VTAAASLTRKALQLLVLLACLLALITARVVVSARDELAQAQSLLLSHDRDGAIVHLRRAARWYAPFSPYHVRALTHLSELGRAAEQAGETALALSAYRALRGAILATRSLYVPERQRLEAANERIATLMAKEPVPGMDAGKSPEQLRAEHLALLSPIPGPNVWWSVVVLLGFACWVSSAFAFSIRAIDDQDRWVLPEVRRWSGLIALGFSLFVLGLVLA